MNSLIQTLFGVLVLLAIYDSTVNSENNIGLPCNPNASWRPFNTHEDCGRSITAYCNRDTQLCDCSSHMYVKEWLRTYEDGECRLLPGSRCKSNETEWYQPEFQRCVKNAKCVPNGSPDISSMCPPGAACELGDGNCVCESGLTCLDKRIPAPPKSN